MTVTVRSFAKINLGLRIGGARADGFHDLLTVYQTIGLHDVIRVSVQRGTGIEIRCEDPRVPRDESNTCFRIVERAMKALKAKGRVVIEIEKRLPVQGGLGGASANAVATLLGLERAVRKTLPAAERLRIAADVGSDLPLFLVGGTVLGVGRGEHVYPLPDLPAIACVVVTPEVGVSTPKAFAEWDRRRRLKPTFSETSDAVLKHHSSTMERATGDLAEKDSAAEIPTSRKSGETWGTQNPPGEAAALQKDPKLTMAGGSDRMNMLSRELSAWLSEPYSSAPFRRGRAENPLLWLVRAGIKNDFEEVVFPEYPELCEGKRALERAGAKYASLSGSGSTLYGLFGSKAAAERAVARLRKQGWAARATSTVTRHQYWRRIFDC
jgi:4-diphosphocytidyl-2-C-methyl-D-erythritol kinase